MINVVLCTDEKYAAYSATVMVSALENSCHKEKIHFYLLTPGLTKETEYKLESTIKKYNAKLEIINVDVSDFTSLKIDLGRFGIGTLLRLYMHCYLPENVNKVIYLDCDLVILGDLQKLWEKKLNGFPIGAVTDLCSPKSYKERTEHYFNAGVLLIDLKLWREINIGEKALRYLSENSDKAKYLDQDALNFLLSDHYFSLDLSWNFQPASYSAFEKKYDYLKNRNEELYDSIKKPNIVHFIGSVKPWHAECSHPLQDLFVLFSKKTPWPINIKILRADLSKSKKINFFLKVFKIKSRRKMTKYKGFS